MSSQLSMHPLVIGPISLSPWSNFDKAWTAVMGYPADQFRFVPGKTPLSTVKETLGMIVLYLVVIFGGQRFMRTRPALKLNGLFMVHNFCLTVVSGSLLVLFAQQLIPSLYRHGLYENICGADGWTQPLVVLYYVSRIEDPEISASLLTRIAQLSYKVCRVNRHRIFDG